MKTELLSTSEADIEKAGRILADGGLVGMQTETVYGLAANALNGAAVADIFKAKGRPMDNPLIVHIQDIDEWTPLVSSLPQEALDLAEAYWPGPRTIILPRSDLIPHEVSAGLPTVAVRMPSHLVARAIIRSAGVPLAAPSANTSGKPSPTTAAHVMHDMEGKIAAVVDGGPCGVGVESTVITLAEDKPKLLRPGRITPAMLEAVLGPIEIHHAVLGQLEQGEEAASPGMKYKHYSPNANVAVVTGSIEKFAEFVNSKDPNTTAALVFDGEEKYLNCTTLPFGKMNDELAHASTLFADLRKCDDLGFKEVYVRCPSSEGVGLAVMNRLLRAAAYEVIDL